MFKGFGGVKGSVFRVMPPEAASVATFLEASFEITWQGSGNRTRTRTRYRRRPRGEYSMVG